MNWQIDLDNLNPGTKFDVPDSEKGEWVEFRIASDDDIRGFRKKFGKKVVKQVVNKDTRRVEIIKDEELDEDALNDEINDFCIPAWLLVDRQGIEIPCTRENKLKLMGGHPQFAQWASECLQKLRDVNKIEAEDERKN